MIASRRRLMIGDRTLRAARAESTSQRFRRARRRHGALVAWRSRGAAGGGGVLVYSQLQGSGTENATNRSTTDRADAVVPAPAPSDPAPLPSPGACCVETPPHDRDPPVATEPTTTETTAIKTIKARSGEPREERAAPGATAQPSRPRPDREPQDRTARNVAGLSGSAFAAPIVAAVPCPRRRSRADATRRTAGTWLGIADRLTPKNPVVAPVAEVGSLDATP